jgi:hypothetical protein
MNQRSVLTYSTGNSIALLLLVTGGLFAAYAFIWNQGSYPNIITATFLDSVSVPFNEVSFGGLSIPIELDNFIVFQEFKAIAPSLASGESFMFGIAFFLIAVTALTSFSYFQKFPFLGAGLGWILLLTFSNVNGLNVGGLSSNNPLIILISGSLIPVVYFHIWKTQTRFWIRWSTVFVFFLAAVFMLLRLSPIEKPELYLAEQALIPALGFGLAWIFWQGHAVVSGLYILLAKANQNLSTKISIQITIIAVVYFLLLLGLILDLKGEVNLPFPVFSPLYLVVPIGILGWISTRQKLRQEAELAAGASKIKLLYFLGIALLFWVLGKIEISANQPAKELVKHLLVYSQFAFSLFFFIYLMSNFLSVMNTGKAVHRVLYKPHSLPYYHLRIGGVIGILVVTIYMEAIVAAQFNSLTTNTLGDYYLQTGKKLEASILYENSWDQYRYNPKAKFLTAKLLIELNQPSLAKEHLEQSFSEAPQIENILLLCERLNRENKLFEVIYYLENGLKFFPENPYLVNNLALFYTLTQRYDDAKNLLQANADKNEVSNSNWIALQSKLGLEVDLSASSKDLISNVNLLAAIRKNGKTPDKGLLSEIRNQVRGLKSPMLLNAAWRNLVTERNISDPFEDLKILDSLARQEELLDFTMQLQETASLRSLGAGRVMEAVKNLNGLAFRNPGDAAYYLQLTARIQAQNLDFEKAARDLIVADEKGFQAFSPSLINILELGGFEADAQRIMAKHSVSGISLSLQDSEFIAHFNEILPEKAIQEWKELDSNTLKTQMAYQLFAKKAHGLSRAQLQEVGEKLKGKTEEDAALRTFLGNPDWANKETLLAFTQFLGVSDELTANPYLTPLVLSAADRVPDPLDQYETINAASDFNRDPLLWIRKVQAAKRIGLDNYATAAIQEMNKWMTWDEIEKLQMTNY